MLHPYQEKSRLPERPTPFRGTKPPVAFSLPGYEDPNSVRYSLTPPPPTTTQRIPASLLPLSRPQDFHIGYLPYPLPPPPSFRGDLDAFIVSFATLLRASRGRRGSLLSLLLPPFPPLSSFHITDLRFCLRRASSSFPDHTEDATGDSHPPPLNYSGELLFPCHGNLAISPLKQGCWSEFENRIPRKTQNLLLTTILHSASSSVQPEKGKCREESRHQRSRLRSTGHPRGIMESALFTPGGALPLLAAVAPHSFRPGTSPCRLELPLQFSVSLSPET